MFLIIIPVYRDFRIFLARIYGRFQNYFPLMYDIGSLSIFLDDTSYIWLNIKTNRWKLYFCVIFVTFFVITSFVLTLMLLLFCIIYNLVIYNHRKHVVNDKHTEKVHCLDHRIMRNEYQTKWNENIYVCHYLTFNFVKH